MATLRIEHAITDLATWLAAFGRFQEARARAGVRAVRVARPVGDDAFICVDLDFDSVEQAEAFHAFLRERVWASPEASPGLGGSPRARVLRPVDGV